MQPFTADNYNVFGGYGYLMCILPCITSYHIFTQPVKGVLCIVVMEIFYTIRVHPNHCTARQGFTAEDNRLK